MRRFQKVWMSLGVAALMVAFNPGVRAQVNSNQANVALTATLAESITVASSAGTLTVPIVANGTGAASPALTITTTWAIAKGHTSLKLFAYFAGANAMTDGAGDNIPAANVLGSVNAGAYGAFTTVGAYTANSVQMFSLTGGALVVNSTRNDTLNLEINSTGLALPAATYTGTLNIQAQAI